MKNTYKSILQEMSERTLKSDTLEGDAQFLLFFVRRHVLRATCPQWRMWITPCLWRWKNVVLKEATMPPAAYGRFMSTAMPEPLLAATLQRR